MIDVHKSKLVLERRKKCLFPIPLVVETNLFNSSFISQFIKNIPQNIDRIIRIFLSILTLPFFLSTNNLKPTTFSSIWSSSWSIFQFHNSIVSKKKNTHSKERKKAIPSRKNPRFPITLNRSSKLGFSFRRGRITVGIRKFSHVLGHG